MKKIIIFIIFILFPFTQLSASEIFGNISTNPQSINNEASDSFNSQEESEEKNESPEINFSGNSFFLPINQENKTEKDEGIITLGIKTYTDNTLLRGEDNKIYLINKGFKIYISNLKKLREFAGQIIYDVEDDELENYKNKKYFINDLIRERGDEKVFVITNSGLKHVLNLEELRLNYFGLEIFNLSREEMDLYG